ncbi:TlpA family protein disulfide reductase [Undibacterium sp. CY18W]|uniref:TlpA family protein disulfide reductase n=1 Tax=Undibacterium hunanense TaxID=2762292 RepID=A0ABR6ZKR9_9BURK|nr:TlpA disulfide reductase family protein [Undibacterium hunanense]MBC3916482.1 TlpA family protein disulfide reductase [Undibacterium hunanense]
MIYARPLPHYRKTYAPAWLATSVTVALVVALGCWHLPAHALDAGKPAPEFSVQGGSGPGPIQLADYKGKLLYLDFWASWCGPCKQSFPWMNSLQSKYAAQGLQVLAVNLDSKAEDAAVFLKSVPASFQIGYDPKGVTPRLYDVKGMPSSVLIDRDGKVLSLHAGFNEGSKAKIEQAIVAALGGK